MLLIKAGLSKAAVIGVDETNLRVQQKQQWVHVSATDKLTLLVHDKRRGTPAIENIGILSGYKGICVQTGSRPTTNTVNAGTAYAMRTSCVS